LEDYPIAFGILILLFRIVTVAWWFMPVHFLSEIEVEEVAAIKVFNGNNQNEFEIVNPDDISIIVEQIKQTSFRKEAISSEVDYWYCLIFINKSGEEIGSLGIQNKRIIRKDITQRHAAFYRGDEGLGVAADYLDKLESVQFPDYKKDPSP